MGGPLLIDGIVDIFFGVGNKWDLNLSQICQNSVLSPIFSILGDGLGLSALIALHTISFITFWICCALYLFLDLLY